jgi:hypothetical protein
MTALTDNIIREVRAQYPRYSERELWQQISAACREIAKDIGPPGDFQHGVAFLEVVRLEKEQ